MKPLRSLLALVTIAPALNAATFLTTGVYDENVVATNTVDVEAPGSTISLASFTSLVSAAFTADRGGVIDFEVANGVAANLANTGTFTASYGVTQAGTMTISKPIGGLSDFSTNNNNVSPVGVLSGTRYMGVSNSTAGNQMRFSSGLETLGFTILSRNAAATNVTVTFFFADTTSVVLPAFNLATTGTDTFVGYTSPSNFITGVDIVAAGSFARIDDVGFIVPEPSAAALGGLGALALLRRRRA